MSGSPPSFEIRESQDGVRTRLSLSGDLDMQSVPELEHRLARLRAARTPVRLDLSKLSFIDSTGLHLLVRTVGDARLKGWGLEIDSDVAPDVMRVLRLVRLDRFVLSEDSR
jgi:anti-anti-sigma factor